MNPELRAMLEEWLASGTDLQKAHARYRLSVEDDPEYPTMGAMAVSAVKAFGHFVAGGLSSHEEQSRRLSICEGCEHFDHDQNRCRVCGCFANLKARIEREHCPIGKW